jgi:hypothetical protein
MNGDAAERDDAWHTVYDSLRQTLLRFGTEDVSRSADFWVDEDDWGHPQQKMYVRNLDLLRPPLIAALQAVLSEFPEWEIVIAVSVPGTGDTWPDMGLTVRAHEVVEDLRREYLPAAFRGLSFASGTRS